jgi:hypothetical protein
MAIAPPIKSLATASVDPFKKIADLEARLARLESALSVDPAGEVTLKSTARLRIEAQTYLDVRAGSGIRIDSATTATFKAATTMTIEGATVTVKAMGNLALKGSAITNN